MADESRKPIEQWKQEKQTPEWLFAAARQMDHPLGPGKHRRWATGEEVTEKQYDAAIQAAGNVRL